MFRNFFIFLCIFLSLIEHSLAKSKKKEFITAQSAIIVDLSNDKIIYSRDMHAKYAPASTVKILTALVALEKLSLDEQVVISKKAANTEPTKIWLACGVKFNSIDLIKAALISSANDACVALAEAVSGSEEEFTRLMTKKAKILGAKNSNFENSSGLPKKNQYSTAYDLYRIVKAAFKNTTLYNIMNTKQDGIIGTKGKRINLANHNKLLFKKSNPLVLVKTGYTKSARHCYAGIADFGIKKYAIAILKSKNPWKDIDKLVNFIKEYRDQKSK